MFGKIAFAECLLAAASITSLFGATYEVAQHDPAATDDGDGSAERPWKTIRRAAQIARAGDIVFIREGIYREEVIVTNSGTANAPIVFEAAPGAVVTLTGADFLQDWRKEGTRSVYSVPWKHAFIPWSKNMTHPDDLYHRLIGRCEQVAVEGYLLRQVLQADQLAPGAFFADVSNHVLQVWDSGSRDLNKVLVEASVRPEIFRAEGSYVELRGLRFRFAANMAQHAAVVLAGSHDVLEDCAIAQMNSSGAVFLAPGQVARRCVFRDNGQLGFGANGAHDLLFTECLVENNNTKGFDRGWEAGGDKLVLTRNAVLQRSRFTRNRGHGIWFDIGNEHCVVRQCLLADNEDSGIFCEISYALRACDNVIVGNGFAATAGGWGAQAGIALSSSPECVVERNLILGNREGFNFREQTRATPRVGGKEEEPVWNHDEIIRHNIIAFNRDAQVWGWFDIKDGRHWPAREQGDGLAADRPLTLEKLHLSFEDNVYFARPGQGLIEWGASWGRHRSYSELSDFQTSLGIDQGGRVLRPAFANLNALDCRLSAKAMDALKQNYPQESPPGVTLGLR